MSKSDIQQIIERHLPEAGLVDTALKGVQLFRVTEPVPCTPAVYDPTIVAIVSGSKEAILDGQRHVYDNSQYMCCPMTMPVEAGVPHVSPDAPLLGVVITIDGRAMTELSIDMDTATQVIRNPDTSAYKGLAMARWDPEFAGALLRLLQLLDDPVSVAVLGQGRLRELYYAVLNGEAGAAARRAFGVGNEIARTIEYLSSRLNEPISVDDMAARVGMSRAVFHRRFKEVTTMSPIQFVKSMRLNNAAMKIAGGKTVSEAAWDVGYASTSQFSREFKRMYGQSPRQWGSLTQASTGFN